MCQTSENAQIVGTAAQRRVADGGIPAAKAIPSHKIEPDGRVVVQSSPQP
jgi:hypothetical protein